MPEPLTPLSRLVGETVRDVEGAILGPPTGELALRLRERVYSSDLSDGSLEMSTSGLGV